jgi:hypothetical protein
MAMTADGGPRNRSSRDAGGGSALIAAWLLMVALFAAVFAWLVLHAEDTRARRLLQQMRVEMPIPAPGERSTVSVETVPPPLAARLPAVPRELPPVVDAPTAAAVADQIRVDPALLERTPLGDLPLAAADGRAPWRQYARPFADPVDRPRVSVVVTGLGLNATLTERTVEQLPGEIALAYSPYAERLDEQLVQARADGHEVLLSLAMEPVNFPLHDPGPYTLMTGVSEAENVARAEWVLGRAKGYVGVIGEYGSRFSTSARFMLPPLEMLKRRGVMYVDGRPVAESAGPRVARDLAMPRASIDIRLDREMNAAQMAAQLQQAERVARARAQVVVATPPFPINLNQVMAWIPTLAQKGLILAPITAASARQPD